MRLVVPTAQEMLPMLYAFHQQAGDCGYTVRKSLQMLDQALRDPLQTVMGAFTDPNPPSGEAGGFVGYVWAQMQDDFAFVLQAWSRSSVASRLLSQYAEEWAKSRGAFTMRAGVSRKWLKALEKRYGYVAKQVVVEKRLT